MNYVRLSVEAVRRAIDGQMVIVGVAKRNEIVPQGFGMIDATEEACVYFLGWTMPRCSEFDAKVRRDAKRLGISASSIFALCNEAEGLANDPERAAGWPFKVVFDNFANTSRATKLM